METKEMIELVAFEAFLEAGFDAISLNEIIKRTGLTKGAFYYHFKNKEELLSELIQKFLYGNIEEQIVQVENVQGNALEKIRLMASSIADLQKKVVNSVDIQVNPKAFYALFMEGLRKDSLLRQHNQKNTKRIRDVLSQFIEQGQNDGFIKKNINPDHMAHLIDLCAMGAMNEWATNDDLDLKMIFDKSVTTFINLIKVE